MDVEQTKGTIIKVKKEVKDLRRKPYGPNSIKKLKRRAILKHGEYNIIQPKFHLRYLHYLKDIFTSLVDAEWKWTLQAMVVGFTGCWLSFALLWWLIAFVHKDLHDEHLPAVQAQNGWTPCILNIYGFHSCFLYSLETQSTMGYGSRAVTEECPEAIFLLCAQCLIGTFIDSFTIGVVFAKLTRPRLTAYTVQFSKNAVVCMRDDEYCLMVRIGDLRKSRLINVNITALLIHTIKTKEGEKLTNYETKLEIQCDETCNEPFLLWPVTVVHKITEDSPFYKYSSSEMLKKKFELIIILDGVIESTGQNTHAKSSYVENEILWGQKFENAVTYNDEMDCYEVNYKYFDRVTTVPMPICSAAEFEIINEETCQKANLYYTNSKERKKGPYLTVEENGAKNRNINKKNYKNKNRDLIKGYDYQDEPATPPFPVDWV